MKILVQLFHQVQKKTQISQLKLQKLHLKPGKKLAKKLNAPLEISPKIVEIFKDGEKKYGSRAWSSMIVKRMEDLNKIDFRANGFPDELVDNEPEEKGYEI